MNDFITFQSYYTEEEALIVSELLEKHGIRTRIEKAKELDKVIGGDDHNKKIYLNIRQQDFDPATTILEKEIEANISRIGDDYYLYSFSNEELLEIVHKADEWSIQDFFIARKILQERNIDFSEKQLEDIKSNRTKELEIQEKVKDGDVIVGYVLAVLFSIVGLFFGLSYMHAKKILPDGNRIYAYTENTRWHGRIIFIISLIILIVSVLTGVGFLYPDLYIH